MKISHGLIISAAIAAIFVAICVAIVPQEQASAAPLQAGSGSGQCSLPYITEVVPAGDGKYLAEVHVAGDSPKLSVKCGYKKARSYKLDAHTWSVEIKQGKTYKFTAKAGKSKWTVSYKIGG